MKKTIKLIHLKIEGVKWADKKHKGIKPFKTEYNHTNDGIKLTGFRFTLT